jgi:NAD(P)-dependent dehydrogenase (short-subunit alcohol dehydrogenase family)
MQISKERPYLGSRLTASRKTSVAVADHDKSGLDKLVTALGDDARIYSAAPDVSDGGQVELFVAEAKKKFGNLHGLVNCAGIKGVGTPALSENMMIAIRTMRFVY